MNTDRYPEAKELSFDEKANLNTAPACLDQGYIDSLMDCFELFAAKESSLVKKATAQGINTAGMTHENIARALYKNG